MDIFDLMATLRLDSSEYDSGLSDAENKASSFGSALKSGLGTAAKVGGVAVGAMAAGVTALGAGFVKSSGDIASYGDDIDKMSQKIGISAEAYQEWDAVLQHSGTSVSALRPSMKTLFKEAQDGNEAFEKLGISQERAASLSKEDLFSETITALQNVTDENEKAALAQELLGKGAMEMGALLNTSAEDTQAMKDKVHELGGVMSDEAVKAAARYQDSLQDMNTAIGSVKRNLMSDFLPSFADVMDGISELFSGDSDKGLGMISSGIDRIISGIADKLPKVIEIGGSIINSIIQGITNNLPKVIGAASEAMITLVSGIVQNLPSILNAGIQAILALASGISDALPDLIPVAVDAILTFVDGLIDSMPQIIEAALQLMIGLAEGLIRAIPRIIERIPEIIASIVGALVGAVPQIATAGVQLLGALVLNLPEIISSVVSGVGSVLSSILDAVTGFIPNMIDAGKNLILGLGEGIANFAGGVIDKVRGIGNSIMGGIKGIFGIASPSKEFKKIGGYLMQGMADGIEDGIGLVEDAMDDMSDAVYDGVGDDIFDTQNVVTTRDVLGDSGSSGSGKTETLLRQILEAMQGIGMYINGTDFVGYITPDMDTSLGSLAYYRSREGVIA